MREITATFIGHGSCPELRPDIVQREIMAMTERGIRIFLCGGMGQFDRMCARSVWRQKQNCAQIKSCLVIPYLTFSVREPEWFDEIIYPEELENVYFKRAILLRNRYLVQHSAHALCYVNHGWGGAARTYELARKERLNIINIGRME